MAFYAVGAYSYALMASPDSTVLIALGITEGVSFWVRAALRRADGGDLAGVLLGFPVLRLRGDYLAIVTLGFGEIIRVIAAQLVRASPTVRMGFPRFRRPSFFGLEFTQPKPPNEETLADVPRSSFDWVKWTFDLYDNGSFFFIIVILLILALLTNWFTLRIRKLPVGRAWEALREDEIACRSLGHQPDQHQAHRLCASAPCSAAFPGRSSPPGRASSAPRASPSSNPR